MAEIPIILLAAGSSSRMGQPKQLLPWGNITLIEHQIQTLTKTGNPLIVVLGGNAGLVLPVIEKYRILIALNQNWRNGMGTSIACGIQQVQQAFPKSNGALIALLDQPLVPALHYTALLDKFESVQQQIIASHSVKGWLGVPVLYDAHYFDELSQLTGEQGAKTLIKKYSSKVISIDGGDQMEDIDTPESYRRLLRRSAENIKKDS